jgi:hypothetical protein
MDPDDFARAVGLLYLIYVALALWAMGLVYQMALAAHLLE